jgi:hypothetical protein
MLLVRARKNQGKALYDDFDDFIRTIGPHSDVRLITLPVAQRGLSVLRQYVLSSALFAQDRIQLIGSNPINRSALPG